LLLLALLLVFIVFRKLPNAKLLIGPLRFTTLHSHSSQISGNYSSVS